MPILAKDIMKTEVIAVPTTMDLRELAKLFLEKGITGAPVVDPEGGLAGVVSQTDLIYYNLTRGDELVVDSGFYQSARVDGHHVPKGFQFEDFNTGCVEDVMTPVVHSVRESATIESVARMMTRKHIHRVIVRRGRGVAGIISALDVLKVQVKQDRTTAAKKNSKAKKRTPAKKKSATTRRAVRSSRSTR